MRQALGSIEIATHGSGLYDVTARLGDFVRQEGIARGLLTVFIRHTSASLLIQENADGDVLKDLRDVFARLAPERAGYRHEAEGPDDMPAHIKAALTQTSLGIPVQAGRLALGTWQGVYVFEHRAQAHRRAMALHLIGD